MIRPLDLLHDLTQHRGLHLTLDRVRDRWRLGVVRSRRQVAAGARPHRSYEGMPVLNDDQIQAAAVRLREHLDKAPPERGS